MYILSFLQSSIDVLKLDLAEWAWDLEQAAALETLLLNTKQLILEINTRILFAQDKSVSARHIGIYKSVLNSLKKLGFLRWHSTRNNWYRQDAHGIYVFTGWELHYINMHVVKADI